MLRQKRKSYNNQAQIVLEYTILIGIVVVVIFAMSATVKRFAQGAVKIVADQIGNQVNAEQNFKIESGHLEAAHIASRTVSNTVFIEHGGEQKRYFNDYTTTSSNTFSDLGFQNTDPFGDK